MNGEAFHLETCSSRVREELGEVLFEDSGFLGVYYFGAVAALRKYAKGLKVSSLSGSSAGALAGVCLLLDLPIDSFQSCFFNLCEKARRCIFFSLNRNLEVFDEISEHLQQVLPEDAHLRLSGVIRISVTDVLDARHKFLTNFASKQELINALISSMFCPLFVESLPMKIRNVRLYSGGLSIYHIDVGKKTLTVSPFPGDSKICPSGKRGNHHSSELSEHFVDSCVSAKYFRQLSSILFPPSQDILTQHLFAGFQDTARFLVTSGLTPICPVLLTAETSVLQDSFSVALVTAAHLIIKSAGLERAKVFADEFQRNDFLNAVLFTAKTVLYYTPMIFVARWTTIMFAKIFVNQLIDLATTFSEASVFKSMTEQVLSTLVSALDPVLRGSKKSDDCMKRVRKTSDDKKVNRSSTTLNMVSQIVVSQTSECAFKSDGKHIREVSSHAHYSSSSNEGNIFTELVVVDVEAEISSGFQLLSENEVCGVQLQLLESAANTISCSIIPTVASSLASSRSNSEFPSRRNSFSLDNEKAPKTFQNILNAMRLRERLLTATYKKEERFITASLYDISDADPVDLLGEDILRSFQETQATSRRRSHLQHEKLFSTIDPNVLEKKLENLI